PRVVGEYPTLLPQVRQDGNEVAGIHRPEIDAPLATYTGWNLRDANTGFAGGRASFIGSYIAWPRAQLLSRYRTADDYVGAYATAAVALVRQRFLVPDDLPGLLEGAVGQWQFAASVR
ncbi:MAG TPA: alpha/beta hydrolase domain-containing protein, partial [Myxococcales bacterium]|nr:alpha/beta hydrolase domain-containing protein [Myxococcales bacterium]